MSHEQNSGTVSFVMSVLKANVWGYPFSHPSGSLWRRNSVVGNV